MLTQGGREHAVGLGTRIAYNDIRLAAGHVLSNEPGYYKPGGFGIRIENIILVRPVDGQSEYGGPGGFLKMERVTMVSPASWTSGAGLHEIGADKNVSAHFRCRSRRTWWTQHSSRRVSWSG